MKKVTFSMLFLFIATNLFAQADLKEGSHSISSSTSSDYLSEWLPATVTLGNTDAKVEARYNVAKQEMEINQNGSKFVLNPKNISKVTISNIVFVPSGKDFSFYQLIDQTPQYSFLKFFNKENEDLTISLFKKNTKNGKLIPFKKEGVKKNPFLLDEEGVIIKDDVEFLKLGQQVNIDIDNDDDISKEVRLKSDPSDTYTTFDNREKDISGSVYLYPIFIEGKVFLKNQNTIIKVPLLLNLKKNELYIKYNSKIIVADPSLITKFTILNRIFIPKTDSNFNNMFYEYIGNVNNNSILQSHVITLKDIPYKEGFSYGNPKQKNSISSNYFTENERTGSITPLRKNKKSILSLFGNKKKQIEQYVKQNHINIKDSQNLTKLIKYYHTL